MISLPTMPATRKRNTRRTGNYLENRTVKTYHDLGCPCEKVTDTGRFSKRTDLFGCVDLVAIVDGQPELIQVTTRGQASARRKKIRAANLGIPVRLFLWHKRGGKWIVQSEVVISDGTIKHGKRES